MLAVVGPLVIAQKSLKSSSYTKNRVTAFYLAADAFEFIRNVRDNNTLLGGGWPGLVVSLSKCISPNKCDVDTQFGPKSVVNTADGGPAISICAIGTPVTCAPLNYYTGATLPYYGHSSGAATQIAISPFRREVSIAPINAASGVGRELLVKVSVIWKESILGGQEKTITLYNEIYDWQ